MSEATNRATDARNLLDNPVFKGAMIKVGQAIDLKLMSIDPDDRDKCTRVVLAKQILKGIEREIHRYIQDGEVVELVELDRKRKTIKDVVFRR